MVLRRQHSPLLHLQKPVDSRNSCKTSHDQDSKPGNLDSSFLLTHPKDKSHMDSTAYLTHVPHVVSKVFGLLSELKSSVLQDYEAHRKLIKMIGSISFPHLNKPQPSLTGEILNQKRRQQGCYLRFESSIQCASSSTSPSLSVRSARKNYNNINTALLAHANRNCGTKLTITVARASTAVVRSSQVSRSATGSPSRMYMVTTTRK